MHFKKPAAAAGLLTSGMFNGFVALAVESRCDPVPDPYDGKSNGTIIDWYGDLMYPDIESKRPRIDVLNHHKISIKGNNSRHGNGCTGVACSSSSIIVACNDGGRKASKRTLMYFFPGTDCAYRSVRLHAG